MNLSVGNIPNNRLAFTNRVYLSPSDITAILPTYDSQAHTNLNIVLINDTPYTVASHHDIPMGSIGMNGLQRRRDFLAVGNAVKVQSGFGVDFPALGSIVFVVNLLSKKATGRAKDVDTNSLAVEMLTQYEGQVFAQGVTLAMSFEGTTLEIVVGSMEKVDLGAGKQQNDMLFGQLLAPTDITFSKAKGSQLVDLKGEKLSGGGAGGANNIFLRDFDFEKLGIGGLNAEFNEIFRRAFASRIWPSHIIKQMGISHVRGMLLFGPPGW